MRVVRLFADDSVPHPDGTIDPMRDIASFETKFIRVELIIIIVMTIRP
ncbi:MAG TPA: hypothetical protein VGR15_03795 [Bacteroidota bacterium]|nr:hypothetical protein [Bacteroidota bacterium]